MANVSRETIYAALTPHGQGAIGAVRISGPLTRRIMLRIFADTRRKRLKSLAPLVMNKGYIRLDGDVDSVLMFFDPAPNTYTGDDLAEIYHHNNHIIQGQIFSLIRRLGGRLAHPGEFTKVRLLNGKTTLDEAEGLLDLYKSKTEAQAKQALRHHLGDERAWVDRILEKLYRALTANEHSLEFINVRRKNVSLLRMCAQDIKQLIDGAVYGRALKRGVAVAIVGRVNVGKSTLFNALLGRERAIVSRLAGTTRDVISEELLLHGVLFKIHDTAGRRSGRRGVELLGQTVGLEVQQKADLILLVLEPRASINSEEAALFADPRTIKVINKGDLLNLSSRISAADGVVVSALKKRGLDQLKRVMYNRSVGKKRSISNEIVVTNQRHLECLKKADMAIKKALVEDADELVSVNLNLAIQALGEITGSRVSEQVIDRIFSEFCVGK